MVVTTLAVVVVVVVVKGGLVVVARPATLVGLVVVGVGDEVAEAQAEALSITPARTRTVRRMVQRGGDTL